jgi:hypothetical protein
VGSGNAGVYCIATTSYTNALCTPSLTNLRLEDVDYSIQCVNNAFPTVTNLTLVRDRYHAIAVSGTISTNGQWPALEGMPYLATSSLTVAVGGTLTLPASAIVKFVDGVYLYDYGSLDLQGGQGTETIFTSWHDDAVGGDTNGNGATTVPSAGIWNGISLIGQYASSLQDCVIKYASTGIRIYTTATGQTVVPSITRCTIQDASDDGIYCTSSYATTSVAPTIDHCTIERVGTSSTDAAVDCYASSYATARVTPIIRNSRLLSSYIGILVHNLTSAVCQPTITSCSFQDNDGFAVQNTTTTDVQATGSWWGDATGPHHASTNPSGLGDPVSDRVNYANWLSEDPNLIPASPSVSLTPLAVHLQGLGSSKLDWGDYSGDGIPDLVVCGEAGTTKKCTLYRGDGLGGLTPDPQVLIGVKPGCVRWLDIDGDRALELFVAGTTADSGQQRKRAVDPCHEHQLPPAH